MAITKAQKTDWLKQLYETLPQYLRMYQVDGQPGRFVSCIEGATELGRQAIEVADVIYELLFSCPVFGAQYKTNRWCNDPTGFSFHSRILAIYPETSVSAMLNMSVRYMEMS